MGGMGVLVLMLALLPKLGAGTVFLMRAESPGPIKDKLLPKLGQSAKILYVIYLILIAAETVCLRIAGMPWFDSICHSMASISTGGFAIKNTSIAYYDSMAIDWIMIVFMFLAAVNFSLLFLVAKRDFKTVLKNEELRLYAGAVALSSVVIFLVLIFQNGLPANFQVFTDVVFQVVTLVTSTGFATADYNLWPTAAQCILLALMVMGGCAGSTAGGVKPSRVLMLHRMVKRSVHKVLHPRQVHIISFNGKRVDEDTLLSVSVFFYAYCALLAVGTLVVSFDNMGFATAFSSAVTCLSNIGPGLDAVGPTSNFSALSSLSKAVLSVLDAHRPSGDLPYSRPAQSPRLDAQVTIKSGSASRARFFTSSFGFSAGAAGLPPSGRRISWPPGTRPPPRRTGPAAPRGAAAARCRPRRRTPAAPRGGTAAP